MESLRGLEVYGSWNLARFVGFGGVTLMFSYGGACDHDCTFSNFPNKTLKNQAGVSCVTVDSRNENDIININSSRTIISAHQLPNEIPVGILISTLMPCKTIISTFLFPALRLYAESRPSDTKC